ncbi:DUF1501 domain-containing protein [Vibrio maritimus]|uniref:DUF1501 domain-containing protein n=1 Tax=Vibrio maritimus TaxID=990268 RepID=UPI001F28F52C|nr:DUF1501 domain-containing protein [Vibrio maritimus]
MSITRRSFLKGTSALAVSSVAPISIAIPKSAWANSTQSDYRALVCVLLHGGNDSANMVIPYSGAMHSAYLSKRPDIAYSKGELLPTDCRDNNDVEVGLHPAMEGVQRLMQQGLATSIINVGPMLDSNTRPPGSRRHNSMRLAWQSSYSDDEQRSLHDFGWGGGIMDILSEGHVLPETVATASNRLLAGRQTTSQRINEDGEFMHLDFFKHSPKGEELFREYIEQEHRDCPFESQYAFEFDLFFDAYDEYTAIMDSVDLDDNISGSSSLSRQLRGVKRVIDASEKMGIGGHIFFVQQGGYDTHRNQLSRHNGLLSTLDSALTEFTEALIASGVGENVTTFTMSDFGRTTHNNSNGGTDHGHGGHQLVLGGAVNGGRVYGEFENMLEAGTSLQATVAHESMAMTLASWFGASDTVLNEVFPNAVREFPRNLGFLKGSAVPEDELLPVSEVRASHEHRKQWAKYAIDGNVNTKWSGKGKGVSFEMDFTRKSTISLLRYRLPHTSWRQYMLKIEAIDSNGQSSILSETLTPLTEQDYDWVYTSSYRLVSDVKSIRITHLGNTDARPDYQGFVGIAELEAWGT